MKTLHRLALATGLVVVSSPVFTATDGILASTSTGTTDITLTKGDGVQISNVSDIAFGATQIAPAAQTMDSCIYSTTGSYNVEAQSLNTDGANFRLNDGAPTPSFINYTLEWDDTVSALSGVALSESTAVSGFTGAFTVDPTCGGGSSGRLIVSIQAAGAGGFDVAPTGNYVDTLTLIVSPN